jgi:hypothetical protein
MDDSYTIEEDVTRSNFAFLLNHNLDIRGSMGLFPDKAAVQDLSAIDHHDTTQQFLCSKSSSASVFDRLVQDTNRRSYASKKVNDYRLQLELEYENSFLSQARLSRTCESDLLTRLIQDTQRRFRNYELIENFKKEKEAVKESIKWPLNKTMQVVNRLAWDKREQASSRENLKKTIEEQEVQILQKIRDSKHPKRPINQEIMKRITASCSPTCKHVEKQREKSLKIVIPYSPETKKTPVRQKSITRFQTSPRRKANPDTDDLLMKIKANGGRYKRPNAKSIY